MNQGMIIPHFLPMTAKIPTIMDNSDIILALHLQPGMGPRTIKRLLFHWPNLQELLNEIKYRQLRTSLPAPVVEAITHLNESAIDKVRQWSEKKDHHLLTILDAAYPTLLREIPDPPPVLYLKGQMEALQTPLQSIVGTRKPTDYGKKVAYEWSWALSSAGLGLVSGLAMGVDTLVHEACVQQNRPTIAVLGNGLNSIYPPRNRALGLKIMENGLLLSEFPLNFLPKAGHFPQRNRIISGLALSTLVIESTEKSGTLITARHAVEQNRDVLVVPGPIDSLQSVGCHRLIQQGARLVISHQEVLQCVQSYLK